MSRNNAAVLPQQGFPRISQHPGMPSTDDMAKCEHVLMILPEKPARAAWNFPQGQHLAQLRKQRQPEGILCSRLEGQGNTGLSLELLAGSGSGKYLPTRFEVLQQAGKLAAAALADNPASVGIMAPGFGAEQAAHVLECLTLALLAHSFSMPEYRKSPKPGLRLNNIRLLGLPARIALERTMAEARATNLVRWLTAQPPNKLDAARYRELLQQLAEDKGWKFTFFNERKLEQLGAGAFLAVSQGNAARDAGIVHLRYTPAGSKSRHAPLALVGKGIVFDTGGTNLKPFKAMLDMHIDMSGSAVAVATMAALTELEYPHAVDCWLAITENRISNTGYKSRDIVTACNGVSIEVVHTDAEGRMALADTLALAGREQPQAIIDFATLTGSCISALTERYSGALTNRPALNATLIRAGEESGERIWPFPLDADFDDDIKSQVADVLQCSADGSGDHIQAGRLLQRFVPADCNWVHVDLAAAHRKGGLAQVPGEITGFGPRFALQLILNHGTELLSPQQS